MTKKPTGLILNNLDPDVLYFAKKKISLGIEAGFNTRDFFEYGKEISNNLVKKLKDFFTKELYFLNEYQDSSNFLATVSSFKNDFTSLKKITSSTDYIDMVNFTVYIPEGMNCTYIEQLDLLINSGVLLKNNIYKMIDTLNIKLGEIINNSTSFDISGLQVENKNVVEMKDKLVKEFSAKFNAKHETEVPLERAIKRSGDWEVVYEKLNLHNKNMDEIKNKEVQDKMKKTNELIDIYIKKKEKVDIDKNVILSLSRIVFNTAAFIEFYVSIVYDTIAINNAIGDTIKKIIKAKKEK